MRQTGELRELHRISLVVSARCARKFLREVFTELLLMFSSVYLARSLRSDKFFCTAWPFNLVEYVLIFVFLGQNGANVLTESAKPMFERVN